RARFVQKCPWARGPMSRCPLVWRDMGWRENGLVWRGVGAAWVWTTWVRTSASRHGAGCGRWLWAQHLELLREGWRVGVGHWRACRPSMRAAERVFGFHHVRAAAGAWAGRQQHEARGEKRLMPQAAVLRQEARHCVLASAAQARQRHVRPEA